MAATGMQLQYQFRQNKNVELQFLAAKTPVECDMVRSIVVSWEKFPWIALIFWRKMANTVVTRVRTSGMCSANVTVVVEGEMFIPLW